MSSENEPDDHIPADDPEAGAHEAADADFSDEEWEDFDEGADHEEEGGVDAPVKKKKSSTNMIIIGVAVVVGVGVMFMQMSGHKSSAPSAPAEAAAAPQANVPRPTPRDIVYGRINNPAPSPAAVETPVSAPAHDAAVPQPLPVDNSASQSGGLMNDPSSVDISRIQAAHAPHNTPPAAQAQAQALTPLPPVAAPVAAPQPVAPKKSDIASIEVPVVSPPPVMPATKALDLSDTAPANAKLPANNNAVTKAPSNNDAAIGKQLAQITDQLKALRDSSVSKNEMDDLKAQIGALEKRVDTLAARPVPVPTPAVIREEAAAHDRPEAVAAAHRHHETAAVKAAKAPVKKMTPVHPAAHEAAAESVTWTLKSAQPGVAIVSSYANGQTITVKPGDSLPGIGKISAIRQDNGQWVVVGSGGSIHQ